MCFLTGTEGHRRHGLSQYLSVRPSEPCLGWPRTMGVDEEEDSFEISWKLPVLLTCDPSLHLASRLLWVFSCLQTNVLDLIWYVEKETNKHSKLSKSKALGKLEWFIASPLSCETQLSRFSPHWGRVSLRFYGFWNLFVWLCLLNSGAFSVQSGPTKSALSFWQKFTQAQHSMKYLLFVSGINT